MRRALGGFGIGLLFISQAFTQNPVPNIEITAKVVLEDGAAIRSAPMISLLVPGAQDRCVGREFFLDGTLRLRLPTQFRGCHVSIQLMGYAPFTGFVADGSLIKLQRAGPQHEGGAAVSMTRLNVPDSARKEYEVGEAAMAKKKWSQAEVHFKAAAALYTPYAMAWSELGQSLAEQDRTAEAVEAFEKARAADPTYTKALVQICLAYGEQKRWEEELQISDEAIKLDAVEFPSAYYCAAEANFHTRSLEPAEHFARQALQVDPSRPYLNALVLLGRIFEEQGNRPDAVTEYKNYLKMARRGRKAVEAEEGLARLRDTR